MAAGGDAEHARLLAAAELNAHADGARPIEDVNTADAPAALDATDAQGNTAVHLATACKDVRILRIVLASAAATPAVLATRNLVGWATPPPREVAPTRAHAPTADGCTL